MKEKTMIYDLSIKQDKVFDIFVEFDRICRKHDLKYSMEGGTLIGAVKYGDFVPWDDDVDIVMRRADYEKFLQVAPSEVKPEFFLQSYNNVSQFPLNYAKLCLNGTMLTEYAYSHLTEMHHGIFIDIFPIDNVFPRTFRMQCMVSGTFTSIRGVKLKVTKMRGFKKMVYKWMSFLPIKTLNKTIQFLCTINNGKQTPLRYEVCNPNKKFPPLPAGYYDEYTEIEFRGRKFLAVREYDAFLQTRFGKDYMTELPPENVRVPSHGNTFLLEENK